MNYSIQPLPSRPSFSAFFIFEISPSRRNFARGFATFIFELRIIARFILISLEKDAEMHESRPKIGGFDRQPRTRSFFPIPYPFSRELTRKSFEIFNDRARGVARGVALCVFALRQFFTVFRGSVSHGTKACLVTRNTVRAPTRAGPLRYIQDLLSPLCHRSKWPSENRVA